MSNSPLTSLYHRSNLKLDFRFIHGRYAISDPCFPRGNHHFWTQESPLERVFEHIFSKKINVLKHLRGPVGTPKKALQRSIRHRLTALGVLCMPSLGHFWVILAHFLAILGLFWGHFWVSLWFWWLLLVGGRTKECGGFKKYFSPLPSQMLYWLGEKYYILEKYFSYWLRDIGGLIHGPIRASQGPHRTIVWNYVLVGYRGPKKVVCDSDPPGFACLPVGAGKTRPFCPLTKTHEMAENGQK